MKERLYEFKNQVSETWHGISKRYKIMFAASFLFIFLILGFVVYWASTPEYVPLYTNLSSSETGEIVAAIEAKGIPVTISSDGTSISVPKKDAAKLKVELAHEGIPRSGNINYSVFSENMGFGMTDKQFDVVERDAMQNELRYLIEQIEGIQQAKVMITLPKENLWVTDEKQTATASLILSIRPGLELSQPQVKGLYHLVSKSVPQLPVENIVIMDQNMQELPYVDGTEMDNSFTTHQQQRQIQRDIEMDIQRDLLQLLGRIMGMDKIIVSVYANVDFTKEKREEHLVLPVDDETKEGIAISVQRIQETFSGEGASPDGVPGTGETDIASYPGATGSQNSEYEKTEEMINNEVNRIHKQIESQEYVIDDLTINVGVEPPIADDPTSLTNENRDDIQKILTNVVKTAISTNGKEHTPEEIENKITVFATEFKGRPIIEEPKTGISNALLYGLAALAVLALGGMAFAIVRRNKRKAEEADAIAEVSPQVDMTDFDFDKESPEIARRKRLERLAHNKPDEFVKLLRTWIAEE